MVHRVGVRVEALRDLDVGEALRPILLDQRRDHVVNLRASLAPTALPGHQCVAPVPSAFGTARSFLSRHVLSGFVGEAVREEPREGRVQVEMELCLWSRRFALEARGLYVDVAPDNSYVVNMRN